MFDWFKKRREKHLERSGGFEENKLAIEKTNQVADEVLQKIREMGGERRRIVLPVDEERRLRLA